MIAGPNVVVFLGGCQVLAAKKCCLYYQVCVRADNLHLPFLVPCFGEFYPVVTTFVLQGFLSRVKSIKSQLLQARMCRYSLCHCRSSSIIWVSCAGKCGFSKLHCDVRFDTWGCQWGVFSEQKNNYHWRQMWYFNVTVHVPEKHRQTETINNRGFVVQQEFVICLSTQCSQ